MIRWTSPILLAAAVASVCSSACRAQGAGGSSARERGELDSHTARLIAGPSLDEIRYAVVRGGITIKHDRLRHLIRGDGVQLSALLIPDITSDKPSGRVYYSIAYGSYIDILDDVVAEDIGNLRRVIQLGVAQVLRHSGMLPPAYTASASLPSAQAPPISIPLTTTSTGPYSSPPSAAPLDPAITKALVQRLQAVPEAERPQAERLIGSFLSDLPAGSLPEPLARCVATYRGAHRVAEVPKFLGGLPTLNPQAPGRR
jgi:hypothetical protein